MKTKHTATKRRHRVTYTAIERHLSAIINSTTLCITYKRYSGKGLLNKKTGEYCNISY